MLTLTIDGPLVLWLPMLLAAVAGAVGGAALWSRFARRRASAPPAVGPRDATPPERPAGEADRRRALAATLWSGQRHAAPALPAALPEAADLLLVDDSAVARAMLRTLFEGAGYKVHLARDGVEALALLRSGRYAMMITDLEMPNMDGVTLINTCLADAAIARMPILAISGHEDLRARFNACRDVCGVHRKPWADDILLSHVAALVSRSAAEVR
jgi:CheY-like chemotaxis protein